MKSYIDCLGLDSILQWRVAVSRIDIEATPSSKCNSSGSWPEAELRRKNSDFHEGFWVEPRVFSTLQVVFVQLFKFQISIKRTVPTQVQAGESVENKTAGRLSWKRVRPHNSEKIQRASNDCINSKYPETQKEGPFCVIERFSKKHYIRNSLYSSWSSEYSHQRQISPEAQTRRRFTTLYPWCIFFFSGQCC